jgi:Lipoprotein LpqB beta-propeller domain/Sporulation and spore germination
VASRLASRRAAGRDRGPLRPVLAALAALAVAAFAAGCVSMPSGGAVRAYTITQEPGAQSQPFLQMYPEPPGSGWTPEQVVTGFLTASGSFANGQQVAREYLTPQYSHKWDPGWSATVFSNGPNVVDKATFAGTGSRKQATVTVAGRVQASLNGNGRYAVPSAKEPEGQPSTFKLVQVNGQWRISDAPKELLLTSDLFKYDYQLRNLYFFDPTGHFLVPDPVYVPQQATSADLMNGLVRYLINPPPDWLSGTTSTASGAINTAFPTGTNLSGDVTLGGGTATVNLSGAIAKLPDRTRIQVMEQVSAQLLWTLSGSGQGGPAVQSVEVSVNNKPPWSPPNSDENPVQHQVSYSPPTGGSRVLYYLDSAGNLRSFDTQANQAKPGKLAHVGKGYSQIAVSPDGQYLAALRNGSLYIGPIHGPLSKRYGTGYTTMSWDPADNLWATTSDQVVVLRGAASPRQQLGQPVSVPVVSSDGVSPVLGPFTAVRVAPDGVRVAIIVGGTALYFGAIVPPKNPQGARVGQTAIKIVLSPFYVTGTGTTTFSSVTWYGPDNVITLGGGPGPVLTEYPVDGGTSTSIPAESGIRSITASLGSELIAGLGKDDMLADASLTGSWMRIGTTEISPVYPG